MEKICLHCQKPFPQRDNENNYRYQRRKFCSQYCYNRYMRSHRLGWYSRFTQPAPETLSPDNHLVEAPVS